MTNGATGRWNRKKHFAIWEPCISEQNAIIRWIIMIWWIYLVFVLFYNFVFCINQNAEIIDLNDKYVNLIVSALLLTSNVHFCGGAEFICFISQQHISTAISWNCLHVMSIFLGMSACMHLCESFCWIQQTLTHAWLDGMRIAGMRYTKLKVNQHSLFSSPLELTFIFPVRLHMLTF